MALSAAVISLVLSGCGMTSGNQASPPQGQQNQTQGAGAGAGNAGGTGNGARTLQTDGTAGNTAAHLERLAAGVPGVRDATVVMLGRTAIVGLDVDENLDRTRVGTLKYSVAQAVRKDPAGAYAVITADMDIAARVRGIRAAIDAGSPASGFAGELTQLVARIAPQLPRDTGRPPGRDFRP